jgi:hypothetical protein
MPGPVSELEHVVPQGDDNELRVTGPRLDVVLDEKKVYREAVSTQREWLSSS